MSKNIQNYLWLLITASFSALTMILVKYCYTYKINWILLLAVVSECGLVFGYMKILKYDDVLTQFSLVKIIAIMLVAIPSIFLAWTKLTISKVFGILFGIAALYLLK
jgi:hypothetical protein